MDSQPSIRPSTAAPVPDAVLDAAVVAVRAGDREAYRQVVVACEAKVRLVIAAILPDADGVDDLAQEVFVTAYGKLRDYRPGTDFSAWVKAIARNLALNERRRRLRQNRLRDRFAMEFETVLGPAIELGPDRFGGRILEALRECLGRLEDPAHGVTEAFYFREETTGTIARRLGRSDGWVRLVLFRARAALAICLQAKGVGE